MRNKINLEIIGYTIVFLAIGVAILLFYNSLNGNPISAKIADDKIKRYVDNKYSYLDLELEKSTYDYKSGSYGAEAQSKTSIDTHFYVEYFEGKVYDHYETQVLGMHNTLYRLAEEYTKLAKSLIKSELGYENNTEVMYKDYEYENKNDSLKLDMKFDQTLPIDSEVSIIIDLTDSSMENISKILTDSHRIFVKNNCNFSKYGFYSNNNGVTVMIDNVTPKDIESGELQRLLENAKDNEELSGISVYVEEDKK